MSARSSIAVTNSPKLLGAAARAMLQRKCDCGQHTGGGECEECKKKKSSLQRHSAGGTSPAVAPPIVHDVLRSPGQPLDRESQDFFGSRFGRDFSGVRVHTDQRAAESAQAVNAEAYTVGSNLVFDHGRYSPQSGVGRRLLAHELVHVMQQSGSAAANARGYLPIEDARDHHEQEAAHVSDRLDSMHIPSQSSTRQSRIQRQAKAGDTGVPSKQTDKNTPPAPPKAKRNYVSTYVNFSFGDVGRFDVDFKPPDKPGTPCQLDAVSKVKFNFNTSDPIPPSKRAPWVNELVSMVSRHWSYRYPLVPVKPCDLELCDSIAVRVRLEPVTSGEHHQIDVIQRTERSFVAAPGQHSQWSEGDVRPGGVLHRERTALHESGHLFGLEHIWCNSNFDGCYGLTAGSADDVMGRGEYVSARDYEPFVKAANTMTGCEWQTGGPGGKGRGLFSWQLALGTLGLVGGAFAGAMIGGLGGAIALGLLGGLEGLLVGSLIDVTPGNLPTP